MLKDWGNKGLKILTVPCNEFGKQEPGDAQVIKGVQEKYEMTNASHVCLEKCLVSTTKSDGAHEMYKWIVSDCGGKDITWNFWKVLLTPQGNFVKMWDNK